jgi:hypothetical protein
MLKRDKMLLTTDFCRGNRPHGPRKQQWGILLPLLMLVASRAFGSLGEPPRQFEGRLAASVEAHDSGYTMIWRGKDLTHSGFFYHGYAIMECFWFNDHRDIGSDAWMRFLAPYAQYHPGQWVYGETISWFPFYSGGAQVGVVMINRRLNSLSIWRSDAWNFFSKKNRNIAGSDDGYVAPTVQPQPLPQTQPKEKKKDCALRATENLARLKPVSAWCKVLIFGYVINGQPLEIGHAVAVWKIANDSNVMAIDDEDGTYELDTASTDANDILRALAAKYAVQAHSQFNVMLIGRFAG